MEDNVEQMPDDVWLANKTRHKDRLIEEVDDGGDNGVTIW